MGISLNDHENRIRALENNSSGGSRLKQTTLLNNNSQKAYEGQEFSFSTPLSNFDIIEIEVFRNHASDVFHAYEHFVFIYQFTGSLWLGDYMILSTYNNSCRVYKLYEPASNLSVYRIRGYKFAKQICRMILHLLKY